MRALSDCASFDDLRISYLENLSEPRHMRRGNLRQWYFDCLCSGCEDGKREARIGAVRCPRFDCVAPIAMRDKLGERVAARCFSCGEYDISKYYLEEADAVQQEMVCFTDESVAMVNVGEGLLNRLARACTLVFTFFAQNCTL